MSAPLFTTVVSLISLVVGGIIGLVFGFVQEAANRKYQQRYNSGQLGSGWGVMPGSMRRTAGFLVLLAAVQLVYPLIFSDNYKWWVSAGIVAGYGSCLYRQLRYRLAHK